MILVDTSVWADHFRNEIAVLNKELGIGAVAIHPFVIGELACGTLAQRAQTLSDLRHLPHVVRASDEEALTLIERHTLMGRGVGLVDVHILASTLLTPETRLWTHDKRLARIAGELLVAYQPTSPEDA